MTESNEASLYLILSIFCLGLFLSVMSAKDERRARLIRDVKESGVVARNHQDWCVVQN